MSHLTSLPCRPQADAIVGLILAGGLSSRMGSDKSQIQLHGQSLLQRVADRLNPQVDQLLVSRPWNSAPLPLPWLQLTDFQKSLGPLGGILRALHWLQGHPGNWLLSSSCDSPFIPTTLASALFEEARRHQLDLAYVRCSGRNHYTHALWSKRVFTPLDDYLNRGKRSLHGFIDCLGDRAAAVEFLPELDPAFANINTPMDLHHWQQVTLLP